MSKPKKVDKSKPPTEAGAWRSTKEMTKEEMWEEAIRVQEELNRVREEKRCFQLQRDKALAGLKISLKKLDDIEASLRRVREENKEDRRAEIAVLKEKFKHVLSEQNDLIIQMKIEGAAHSSPIQNQYTGTELALIRDIQRLQAEYNERKLNRDELIKELKLKHHMELMEMNHEYECQLRDIEAKYDPKRLRMVQEAQEKLQEERKMLDDKLKERERALMNEHDQSIKNMTEEFEKLFRNVEEDDDYELLQKCAAKDKKFSAGQEMKLEAKLQKEFERWNDKLRSLKSSPTKEHENLFQLEDEPKQLKEKEKPAAKMLPDRQQRNKPVTEALGKTPQKESEQLKNLQKPQSNRVMMMRYRAEKQKFEKEITEAMVKHQMLFQACNELQKECSEMEKKQTEVMLDVQQKIGLKKMRMERKVAVVEEELEKAEAQLCGVLAITSTDPTERSDAARRLEEIMNSKQAIIDGYQEALDKKRKQHGGLQKNYKKKPSASGRQPQYFPSTSSEETLKGAGARPKH